MDTFFRNFVFIDFGNAGVYTRERINRALQIDKPNPFIHRHKQLNKSNSILWFSFRAQRLKRSESGKTLQAANRISRRGRKKLQHCVICL